MPTTAHAAAVDRAALEAALALRAARRRHQLTAASTALLASIALGAAAPSAQAAWPGSPGKVAWIHEGLLKVDDPYDDAGPITITTVPKAENPLNAQAPTSAVAWSPDGTKVAFTKAVDDGIFPDHTAVFVADLSEGRAEGTPVPITQVSHPYAGRPNSCDTCDDGEAAHDLSPVWTPDGDVAYIRFVSGGEDAPHAAERGTSAWVAPVAGQQSGKLATWHPNQDGVMRSIIWPKGASEPMAISASALGFTLRRVVSKQHLVAELGIDDVDASPDGSRIAYRALTLTGPRIKIIRTQSGEELHTFAPALSDAGVRFSPDGSRLILAGCADDATGQQHCGLKTHTIPDPDADIRDDDPEEAPYLDGNPAWVVGPSSAAGGRTTMDIQPQATPVIFIPGFLGSEIVCGGEQVWMPDGPPIHLERVALAADGRSEAACQGVAGPTGKEVDRFIGADVYGHATTWLRGLKARRGETDGWHVLGWDWRKSPEESLRRLDDQITTLLDRPLARRQGVRRVAVATHSYGSLLLRRYLAEPGKARRVARAVTIGAPWWGAPKPMFPIAFGIETPEFSALDLFIANDDLRSFMVNSSGGYSLMPSDNYGQWLRYDGEPQDQGGVSRFLGSVGGNTALFGQARALHQRIDGFTNGSGTIDMRNVTGLGLPTVTKVNVAPSLDGEASVGLVFGQGDGTVPVRSSAQGDEGTRNGLGDRIHQQYRCGIPHMRQTADDITQRAYADFLLDGAIPRRLPAVHCAINGLVVKVFQRVELGQPTPRAAQTSRAARSGGAAPRSLADAELDGDVDVLQLAGGTTIVTSDPSRPVRFEGRGAMFELSPLTDAGEGSPRRYGPTSGTIVIGGTAEAPEVTVDGRPLQPQSTGGAGGAGGAPASSGGGNGNGQAQQQDLIRARLLAGSTLRADARGRVRLKLVVATAASGTLRLTDAKGRALTIAPVQLRLRRAGTTTVVLTLSRPARRALRRGAIKARAAATLRTSQGSVSTASAAFKIRGR